MVAVAEDSLHIHHVHSSVVALEVAYDVVFVVLMAGVVIEVVVAMFRFVRNLDTKKTMNCCYVHAKL